MLLYRLSFSHAILTRLKKQPDGILVDGNPVTVRYVLHTGQTLSLAIEDKLPHQPQMGVCFAAMPEVLYEDDWLIAVDKPAGMPTHPSPGHHGDSLACALSAYYGEKGVPFVFRSPSRLDRNTSGVLLAAKNAVACSVLNRQHQQGLYEKTYFAVLQGEPAAPEGLIDAPIGREAGSVIKRCVSPHGDRAQTAYRVLHTFEREGRKFCAVLAFPRTGRTHQIRVHFAHIGCPLAGDDLYGGDRSLIGRHALHAYQIGILHPKSGEKTVITAPLPADLQELIGSERAKISLP